MSECSRSHLKDVIRVLSVVGHIYDTWLTSARCSLCASSGVLSDGTLHTRLLVDRCALLALCTTKVLSNVRLHSRRLADKCALLAMCVIGVLSNARLHSRRLVDECALFAM